MSTRIMAVVLLCLATAACNDDQAAYPFLNELDTEDAQASGKRLMALPEGLHLLERDVGSATRLLIGIHGYESRGYEWVYPLQTLDDAQTATYFFRWDWNSCADSWARTLLEDIGGLLAEKPEIDMVRLVGHSYGGVLAAMIVETWAYRTPVEIHTIAAPLAGTENLIRSCDYKAPSAIGGQVRLFEWRTRHELDGAFRDLVVNPQVIDLPGSSVTLLPATYRGHRLGHNWSISWVADSLTLK